MHKITFFYIMLHECNLEHNLALSDGKLIHFIYLDADNEFILTKSKEENV